ncbi:hypothetical protein CLOBOL_06638 [Enterocloster bolteae ATCC BAA-613]|uniref:Uncharacterized protein n=1 Tax=Enterocloster bolteae (strain ATCC BAA-613 / DSM 15670 / CCUG 46953 / JCM 12243 / WAL 16351) TaxID=411902 RepID=A8S3J5_ENTBW|nr:hypothetical protein CLOBOL_06638 [Enterocloster bolteae ATCC BAA-613]
MNEINRERMYISNKNKLKIKNLILHYFILSFIMIVRAKELLR